MIGVRRWYGRCLEYVGMKKKSEKFSEKMAERQGFEPWVRD